MFDPRWVLHRLKRISSRERGVLMEAMLAVPLVHQVQQRLPYARWEPMLRRDGAPRPRRVGGPSVRDVGWAVRVAAEYVPGVYKCLPRAYAGHWLLHHHGYASRVQVGVAHDAQGRVEAHAWVLVDGEVVIGDLPDLTRFVPFPALPEGAM